MLLKKYYKVYNNRVLGCFNSFKGINGDNHFYMKLLLVLIIFNFSMGIGFADEKMSLRPNFNTELSSQAGRLSASNIYLSYLSLDLIYERMTIGIEKKHEKKLLASILQINEGLEDNLKVLYSLVESDKDAKFIYELVSITKSLKDNSNNLVKYIEKRDNNSLNIFYESHLDIWTKLKKLFSKK